MNIALVALIVAGYLQKNHIPPKDVGALIEDAHTALAGLGRYPVVEPPIFVPRMPIKDTVTHAYVISLEDGKRYQTLKRHLATLGLTPDEYRTKWSLPSDYPLVAPAYSARRAALAKKAGLGQKRVLTVPATKNTVSIVAKSDQPDVAPPAKGSVKKLKRSARNAGRHRSERAVD